MAFSPLELAASHTLSPRMHALLTLLQEGLCAKCCMAVWTYLKNRQRCNGENDAETEFLQHAQWEFPLPTLETYLGTQLGLEVLPPSHSPPGSQPSTMVNAFYQGCK